jgi:hypothetical protein
MAVEHVRRYAPLLLELHRLIEAGRGDSAEADRVRDDMDGPWHAMTTEERNRCDEVSECLYALAEAGLTTADATIRNALDSFQNGEVDRAAIEFRAVLDANSSPPKAGPATRRESA